MQKKFNSILFGISVLPALLIMPAMAEDPNTTDTVFVLGDIVLTDQHVANGEAAFAGRRMNNWVDGKYQNVFPKYNMVARSFDMSNSDTYVGPVTLTLRELTNEDNLAFNYQVNDIDINLVDLYPALTWNVSEADVVAAGIPQPTAGTIAMFAHLDGTDAGAHAAGSLLFKNTKATIDGATIDANTISITNGSELNFVKQDTTLLNTSDRFFTETDDIDSTGITNLNADTINIADSTLFVDTGASVVFNAGDMANLVNVTSSGNKGVIENLGNMTISGSSFSQGSVTGNGGAIYNSGEMEISNSSFSGNVATGNSGAIAQNDGNAKLTLNNVSFDNNSADWGGAIVARGTVDITGGSFTGNTSSDGGGAIYLATLANKGHKLSINGTTFTNNSTAGVDVDGGGAIGSFSDLTLKNSTFAGNHVDGTASHGGGALFLGSVSTNDIQNVTFTSNTSATNGGAISMRYVDAGDNAGATLDITGSTFSGNNALDGFGGAIYNTFHNDKNDDGYAYVASSTFDGNSASNGGAIYNETSGTTDTVGGILLVKDSTFTSNTTTGEGGAIYNAGILTLDGTNTFSGNTAGGAANDIYNLGTLTFAENSTTTMDGGIMGNGTLNIADGATLNIGTASIVQSELILNGTLNATLKNADEFAFFDISDSFDGATGTLNFDLRAAGEYNVFQGEVLNNERVVVSSSVFDYEWNEGFDTITVAMKSVEDIADENGISNEAATTVANLVNSSSDKLNDFADAIQDKLASGDADAAAAVEHAHAAIHPETESVVQTVAMSVQNTVANLAAGRLMALNIGRNGGDANVTGGGVWAQGVYNKSKQNGAFDGYTRGVAGGADMTLNRVLTLGAGYSYAHSDVSGTARDTEVDSSTIFAYGQYKPTDWFVNAMANYTMSDYSEHAVALGTDVDASYDVHSYGGQVMTGYDFAGGITPAVGVRYMHVTADEYKNSLGIKNKLQDSDYMTAMLETKWTHGFRVNKQFMLRPELRYAVKYDFMSDKQMATVTLPGIDSYAMDGTRLSRLGAEVGGGLGIKFHGLDVSLNYDLEIREGFTSQTGRARIRCEF